MFSRNKSDRGGQATHRFLELLVTEPLSVKQCGFNGALKTLALADSSCERLIGLTPLLPSEQHPTKAGRSGRSCEPPLMRPRGYRSDNLAFGVFYGTRTANNFGRYMLRNDKAAAAIADQQVSRIDGDATDLKRDLHRFELSPVFCGLHEPSAAEQGIPQLDDGIDIPGHSINYSAFMPRATAKCVMISPQTVQSWRPALELTITAPGGT